LVGPICTIFKSTVTLTLGGTYLYHFQEYGDLDPLVGPVGCPETSVRNYHYSLRNDPEERRSQSRRGGNLKSRIHGNCILLKC